MSTGHFFQNSGQARKMQKKSFFCRNGLYTCWYKIYQEAMEFWCTLRHTHRKAGGQYVIRLANDTCLNSQPSIKKTALLLLEHFVNQGNYETQGHVLS